MSKRYQLGVYIGRFQPVHLGHLHSVIESLKDCEQLLILIGSSARARTIKNPFNFNERKTLLTLCLQDLGSDILNRVHIQPLKDIIYSDAIWCDEVQNSATQVCIDQNLDNSAIAMTGFYKDHSSYYLDLFPHWQRLPISQLDALSATPIRNDWLENPKYLSKHKASLPLKTLEYLEKFSVECKTIYSWLQAEYAYIKQYHQDFSYNPYPPIFTTTDAVVLCQNHILLIQRKNHPGQGLWAMPGGFLEVGEWIQAGLIRELKEETQIALSDTELVQSLIEIRPFDFPDRSLIGRVITHAGLFILEQNTLPNIIAADDAMSAKWVRLDELMDYADRFHDDHYQIIQTFLRSKVRF